MSFYCDSGLLPLLVLRMEGAEKGENCQLCSVQPCAGPPVLLPDRAGFH